MTEVVYRRLPGVAASPFRRRTLWLGPDHILSVLSLPFSEQYRRFYFRDIQAIVLAEAGNSWTYYLFASGAFLVLMFLLLGYSWHPVWAVICGAGALAAFTVGIRVPNCDCYLRTATSLERLPSLGRVRAARKALALLKPLIEAAQGQLTP